MTYGFEHYSLALVYVMGLIPLVQVRNSILFYSILFYSIVVFLNVVVVEIFDNFFSGYFDK